MIMVTLTILQGLIFVLAAPLLLGLVKWVKCQLQNRQSPSLFQPYCNLRKLFNKEVILPTTASNLFRIAPYIIFAITVLICLVVPLFSTNITQLAVADVIVIIGLFGLIRFFLALAGMDVGTAFGGMGSSREMMLSALAEPALLLVFFTLAMCAGGSNLSVIMHYLATQPIWLKPSLVFAVVSFVLVAVTETGRIPVDNPATHLELTMVHEAMILEYSGKYLALIEWSAQIKFMLYAVLLVNLFFPFGFTYAINGVALTVNIILLIIKLVGVAIILGLAEISLAKLRLFRVPYLLNFAFILGLLGVLTHIILEVT